MVGESSVSGIYYLDKQGRQLTQSNISNKASVSIYKYVIRYVLITYGYINKTVCSS